MSVAEQAEPSPVARAIAGMDAAAKVLTARIAALPNSRQRIVLSSREWHQVINALAGARGWARTEQIRRRR